MTSEDRWGMKRKRRVCERVARASIRVTAPAKLTTILARFWRRVWYLRRVAEMECSVIGEVGWVVSISTKQLVRTAALSMA